MRRSFFALLFLFSFGLAAHAATYNVTDSTSWDAVPWCTLAADDVVTIQYGTYAKKLDFTASGTSGHEIQINGVPDVNGNLPIIEGVNATTSNNMCPKGLQQFHEGLGLAFFGYGCAGGTWSAGCTNAATGAGYVKVTYLRFQDGVQTNSFTARAGTTQTYGGTGTAGIYMQACDHCTFEHVEITANGNGLFGNFRPDISPSECDCTFSLVMRYSHVWGNGTSSFLQHNVYVEADGVLYEYNWFGTPKSGSPGNNIKDRSAGLIMRYNYIENANSGHLMDLDDCQNGCPAARVDASNNGPYTISTGVNDLLIVSLDGGTNQNITLTAGSRTAAQIASDISAQITSAISFVNSSGRPSITGTDFSVGIGSVQVKNTGTAQTTLGFSTALLSTGWFNRLPSYATYYQTFVYGNVIYNGPSGSTYMTHYPSSDGPAGAIRDGTLYSYQNTIVVQADSSLHFNTYLWQLDDSANIATIDERNDIIYVTNSTGGTTSRTILSLKGSNSAPASNGNLTFGVNWISTGWQTCSSTCTGGVVTGTGNFVSPANSTINFTDFTNQDFRVQATSSAAGLGAALAAAVTSNAFGLDLSPNMQLVKQQQSNVRANFGLGANLGAFDPQWGTATQVLIIQQPTTVARLTNISPAITVRVTDATNITVANSTATITVALGTDPCTSTLSGTTSLSAVSGIATFSNLQLNKPCTGNRFLFSSSGLTGATSSSFNATSGPATTCTLAGFTNPVAQGVSSPFTLTLFDAGGYVATTYTGTQTFSGGGAGASLPSPYAFLLADSGSHAFIGTLNALGTQTINTTDGTVSCSQSGISITGIPGYPLPFR